MSLALVGDPGNGNVVQHPSGLVVLRAEDFLGPARGDLTTAADGDSVAGTVVEETQAFAVPSTFNGAGTGASVTQRWALADDTLRITIATLSPLLSGTPSFDAWLGFKISGDVPSNARYQKTNSFFNALAGGAAVGAAWGSDTTLLTGLSIVPSEQWGAQFKISDQVTIFWSDISGGTDLVLRAWGVTGGTIEFAIDLVYLMPRDGDLRLRYGMEFPPFDLSSNGVVRVDEDNDAADNVIGKFSVGWTTNASALFNELAPLDFQDDGDEPSMFDITQGQWDGSDPDTNPLDPKSWISFVAAPHYIPETTLIDEPFTGSAIGTNGVMFESAQGYIVTGAANNFGGPGHPNGTSGWTRDGAGNMRCSIGASSTIPVPPYQGTPHANLFFGSDNTLTPGSTDPRDYQHTLWGLEDFTSETTFACDTAAGEVNMLAGFQAFTPGLEPTPREFIHNGVGVRLTLSGGALTATLTYIETGLAAVPSFYNGTCVHDFSSPMSVDAAYAANTVYRVKVERRRYRVRAKVWEDGTSEPGAWDLDGYMPFQWAGSGGTGTEGFIDYAYDTNWAGNLSHDLRAIEPWVGQRSLPGMMCWPNPTSPAQVVNCDEYVLTIEPDGATPIDMLVAEENYDFTDRSNDLVIPYATIPSGRFVEGSLRTRHFGADSNGFNLLAWKDGAAGPEMQSSALVALYELAKLGVCLPQIYRLVIF